MVQKVKILDALIWMQKLNISFQSLRMELAQWKEESEDGRTAGVELERTKLKMEGLLVLKEETVATSLAGLVCDPSAFIVEEYSEEVGTSPLLGELLV